MSSTSPHHPPELLAPAGDWDSLRAAVANGANAVYFGLSNFNARHRATNFTLEELPEVMSYLHARNVRGYLAFNTLIFSDELPEAVKFITAAANAKVDALIVQDLGLAHLIHTFSPTLPIHGSTQMTLTESRGINFVHTLGVQRVILARELSTTDIKLISTKTDVPLEVFIHGALCVAYSGQCLTSESLGGRSANRGQCAQACRLPYDLIVDGQIKDLGDKAYLLSPQDLAAHDLVDDLLKIGICSLKIEGRLKSAHYVAAATQTYRAALDASFANRKFQISNSQSRNLAQSFSRGFTHGFLDGPDHQKLVHARFPKSRGIRIGTVVAKSPHGAVIDIGTAVGAGVGAASHDCARPTSKVALSIKAVHTYPNFVRAKKGVAYGPHDLEDRSSINSSRQQTIAPARAAARLSRLAHRRHVSLERLASALSLLGLPTLPLRPAVPPSQAAQYLPVHATHQNHPLPENSRAGAR
ncbi:MAG TPA: peptidase U32 family protein [Tepidisphaeraceae bacterium]|nr:peptidase U32 family protein [Tepidisphaeraceae bacterium]